MPQGIYPKKGITFMSKANDDASFDSKSFIDSYIWEGIYNDYNNWEPQSRKFPNLPSNHPKNAPYGGDQRKDNPSCWDMMEDILNLRNDRILKSSYTHDPRRHQSRKEERQARGESHVFIKSFE